MTPDLQRIVEALKACRERYEITGGLGGCWFVFDTPRLRGDAVVTGTRSECLAYIDARCAEAMVRAIVPAELVEASRKAQAGMLRPGPYKTDLLVDSPKGGDAKLFDVRGLGFYTGKGHGALGLDDSDAADQMDANANFAAAAWNLVRSLSAILGETQP